MMRPGKKALNVHLDSDTMDLLERVCEVAGQSKTTAAERAIRLYADKILGEEDVDNGKTGG